MGLFDKLSKAISGPSIGEICQTASDPATSVDELKDIYVSALQKSNSECEKIDQALAGNPNCPEAIREDIERFY